MALYTIADPHLSLSVDKPMDIFGGWEDYHSRLAENWRNTVKDTDVVVLPGDISWAMSLEEALKDFQYLNSLPGQKYLLKGNHDYWWTTVTKLEKFFSEHGLTTLNIIHNNAAPFGDYAICGTRGWLIEGNDSNDDKIVAREAQRLEVSIQAALTMGKTPLVFLHYPVLFGDGLSGKLIDVLLRYDVKECYYGHLHGNACRIAMQGNYLGIDFKLVSADYLKFTPLLIKS